MSKNDWWKSNNRTYRFASPTTIDLELPDEEEKQYLVQFIDAEGDHGYSGAEVLLNSYDPDCEYTTLTMSEIVNVYLQRMLVENRVVIFEPEEVAGKLVDFKIFDQPERNFHHIEGYPIDGTVTFVVKIVNGERRFRYT